MHGDSDSGPLIWPWSHAEHFALKMFSHMTRASCIISLVRWAESCTLLNTISLSKDQNYTEGTIIDYIISDECTSGLGHGSTKGGSEPKPNFEKILQVSLAKKLSAIQDK